VTHDQEEALSMSDVVVVMNHGRVMQVGKPEEIYRKPASAFVAEFMGVSNVLRGKVSADGRSVTVAGACIPYTGTPGAPVTVVFKADDAQLVTAYMPETVIFYGSVEETFFYGVLYRHFISVADTIILYDRPTPLTAKQVRLAVAREKVQVFADA